MKTFVNSFLFGLKSGSDSWFNEASYTKSSTTALQLTELTSFKVVRMTYLENPTKATEDVLTTFDTAFTKKTNGKGSTILTKFNKIKEESFGKLVNALSESIKDDTKNKIVAEFKTKSVKLADDDDDIFINKPEIHNSYKILNFSLTCINFIRVIFSYLLIFDIAAGGIGVFNMIEALLEIISRIIAVVLAHIKYNVAKANPKLSKETFRKQKREMLDAYAQLAISIVYLTFFPASIIIKGTYEAALKLNDMVSAIKQYSRQIVERNYYKEWAVVKQKHSDLFKNYNICELKFYGYLNIITVLNRIIQDEIEVVKDSRKDSYKALMEALIKSPASQDYIKNQIKELCSENIQFCSRNISEQFLTSLSFTEAEMVELKMKAICGPYTTLAIANTPEEFTSFIDLGYQPITSINYIHNYSATEYYQKMAAKGLFKNLKNKPVSIPENDFEKLEDEKVDKKSDRNMLMGCRSCSKSSVIRHIEIFENTENIDIENQGPLCKRWRERNGLPKQNTNKNEKICDCIYNDQTCLTAKIKYLRLSSNYVLYYEIIKTEEEIKNNGNTEIIKRDSYPALYNIYVWNESQNQYKNHIHYETDSNKIFYLKLHIGIWNPNENKWTASCADTICKKRGSYYNFELNVYELIKTDLTISEPIRTDAGRECPKPEKINIILPSYFIDHKIQPYDDLDRYTPPLFGNNRESICFSYFEYFKSENKIDSPYVIVNSALLKSTWYNWFFYPSDNISNIMNGNIKKKLSLEKLEILSMANKEVIIFSFEPFKVKTNKLSEFEVKLREEAKDICQKNKPDSYDFKTCPNKALNYNYITNKSFFKSINEEDKNSLTKLINKQIPNPNIYSFDEDYHTAFVNFVSEPLLKLKKEITINPKENLSEFALDFNDFSKGDCSIIKYTIKNFQPYFSFKLILDIQNKFIQLSLNLYSTPEERHQLEKQLELNLNQIHNVIYAVVIKAPYDKNLFSSDNKIYPFYDTFLNNNYIMIPIQNKHSDEIQDPFITFIFIKPLPDMGLINNKVYGKTKCLKTFLLYPKTNYSPFSEKYIMAKRLIQDLIEKYSEDKILDKKYNSIAKSINFFNHFFLNKYPTEITRPKYHPFQIFDFEELDDLLFKRKECKDSDFSFSIPIKFHNDPEEDKSMYYRHLGIDKENNIIESYELAGPDVKEIYWIQFTKILNLSIDDMNNADKYGYLPFYTFEHNYYDQYQKFLDKTERGWIASKFDLKPDECTIQITIWLAYDYRHKYNVEDLCEASKETQRLLDDYNKMLKNMDENMDVEDDERKPVQALSNQFRGLTVAGKSRSS